MRLRSILIGLGGGIAFLLIVLACGVFALTRPTPVPAACPASTDWTKIRALANALPGDKPVQVRAEHVLTIALPAALTLPGSPWEMRPMQDLAYQLVFPDQHTIMIDTAMTHAQATHALLSYDDAAWDRVAAALDKASDIYVTHEHSDHLGGLFDGEHARYAHARLTPEQVSSPERSAPAVIADDAKKVMKPLIYSDATAVAPGVVLLKAAGHTPGSQWVYIARADGTELLMVGDTAWFMDSIVKQQGPARLLSLAMRDDRHAVACQLAELHRLGIEQPAVQIVPGHDGARFDALFASGALTRLFT